MSVVYCISFVLVIFVWIVHRLLISKNQSKHLTLNFGPVGQSFKPLLAYQSIIVTLSSLTHENQSWHNFCWNVFIFAMYLSGRVAPTFRPFQDEDRGATEVWRGRHSPWIGEIWWGWIWEGGVVPSDDDAEFGGGGYESRGPAQ